MIKMRSALKGGGSGTSHKLRRTLQKSITGSSDSFALLLPYRYTRLPEYPAL